MRKIVIIGAGFAGTMISHCIAQTNQKCSLVIVSESKELETHIEKNNFPKEIMILTAVPQLEEFISNITEVTKKEHASKAPAVVLSMISRYWYHPLWTRPP